MVYLVGSGPARRLFGQASDTKPMRLVDTKTVGDGIAILTYELIRNAERAFGRRRPSGQARGRTPSGGHPGERLTFTSPGLTTAVMNAVKSTTRPAGGCE